MEQGLQLLKRLHFVGNGREKSLDRILLHGLALQGRVGLQDLMLLVGDVNREAAHGGRFKDGDEVSTNVGWCFWCGSSEKRPA